MIRSSLAASFGGAANADGANCDAQGARDFETDVRRRTAISNYGDAGITVTELRWNYGDELRNYAITVTNYGDAALISPSVLARAFGA